MGKNLFTLKSDSDIHGQNEDEENVENSIAEFMEQMENDDGIGMLPSMLHINTTNINDLEQVNAGKQSPSNTLTTQTGTQTNAHFARVSGSTTLTEHTQETNTHTFGTLVGTHTTRTSNTITHST